MQRPCNASQKHHYRHAPWRWKKDKDRKCNAKHYTWGENLQNKTGNNLCKNPKPWHNLSTSFHFGFRLCIFVFVSLFHVKCCLCFVLWVKVCCDSSYIFDCYILAHTIDYIRYWQSFWSETSSSALNQIVPLTPSSDSTGFKVWFVEAYEKTTLLLSWFSNSVNSVVINVWSQSLVSRLPQYSMMSIL